MDTIADLIEAARKRTGATYTDISERLDRSKQLITNWKSGKKVPTDGDVLALARMAGENADKWLAIAQAARTEGEAKTRWEQIARKLSAAAIALAIGVGLASPARAQAAEMGYQASTLYTLCEIANEPIALGLALDHFLLASTSTTQGRNRSMKHDPHERIELTGPWAGFGFQGGHMWTPEGHTLYPEDMTWWSLTCNIAREWRSMMAAGRPGVSRSVLSGNPCGTRDSKVIFLQDVLRRRQEQRSSGVAGARFADRATVVRATRGPSRHRRG